MLVRLSDVLMEGEMGGGSIILFRKFLLSERAETLQMISSLCLVIMSFVSNLFT